MTHYQSQLKSLWQTLTLSDLELQGWQASSLLCRFFGLLQTWRQSSWLLRQPGVLGFLLVSLIFGLAPFVSTTLLGLLMVACGGFLGLVVLVDEGRQPWLTPVHLTVMLYWGVSVVATGLSPVRQAALSGLAKLTLFLILFWLMAWVLRSPRWRNWLIAIYLHTALIVSTYGLRQLYFGAEPLATWVDQESTLANTTRVYSYLGNPNLLAGYLIPAVALSAVAVFAWRGWLPKALALTMFGMNMICLVFTFSRGGWIGLVATMFVLLVLLVDWVSIHLPQLLRRLALQLVLGAATATVVLAVAFVEPVRDRAASFLAGRGDSSNNFRLNVWAAVLEMIRDRPWLGIGPGNDAFAKIYPFYQRPRFNALGAYSIFLEIAVETGLIGLGCFLWLVLVTLNQGWMQLRRLRSLANPQGYWLIGAIATVIGLMAHGLVDTVWYRPQVSTLWWLMVALIASFYQEPEAQLSHCDSAVEPIAELDSDL